MVIANEPYHLSIPRMTIVIALTSVNRRLPHHVEIQPDPANGLRYTSYAITEQPKAVSAERLRGDPSRLARGATSRADLGIRPDVHRANELVGPSDG